MEQMERLLNRLIRDKKTATVDITKAVQLVNYLIEVHHDSDWEGYTDEERTALNHVAKDINLYFDHI